MVATILGLILHLAQTIGYFWYLANMCTPSPTTDPDIILTSCPYQPTLSPAMMVLDVVGFILPSYLLLIVYSFRFVLLNLNNSS